jgi:hypothetical protein
MPHASTPCQYRGRPNRRRASCFDMLDGSVQRLSCEGVGNGNGIRTHSPRRTGSPARTPPWRADPSAASNRRGWGVAHSAGRVHAAHVTSVSVSRTTDRSPRASPCECSPPAATSSSGRLKRNRCRQCQADSTQRAMREVSIHLPLPTNTAFDRASGARVSVRESVRKPWRFPHNHRAQRAPQKRATALGLRVSWCVGASRWTPESVRLHAPHSSVSAGIRPHSVTTASSVAASTVLRPSSWLLTLHPCSLPATLLSS